MTSRRLQLCLLAALACVAADVHTLAAQSATEADHVRVAGCYMIEPAQTAPWLEGVDARVRLTMEPVEAEPGSGPQYLVRPAEAGSAARGAYPFLAWSLYGGGRIVSIVWSSARQQIGLTFVPEPERGHVVLIGSTTFFEHDLMKESEPVDVQIVAIDC